MNLGHQLMYDGRHEKKKRELIIDTQKLLGELFESIYLFFFAIKLKLSNTLHRNYRIRNAILKTK